MNTFNNVSLKTIEDYVIATGQNMTVYGIGPVNETNLDLYSFYQSEPMAQAAFSELVSKGDRVNAVLMEFGLNKMGYIQAKPVRLLSEWLTSGCAENGKTLQNDSADTIKNTSNNSSKRDSFDNEQEFAQQKYHDAQKAIENATVAQSDLDKKADETDEKSVAYYEAQDKASEKYDDLAVAAVAQKQSEEILAAAKENAQIAAQKYNEAKAAAKASYQASVDAAKQANEAEKALNEASQNTITVTEIYEEAQNAADEKYQAALDAARNENEAIDALAQMEVDAEDAYNQFRQAETTAFKTGQENLKKALDA